MVRAQLALVCNGASPRLDDHFRGGGSVGDRRCLHFPVREKTNGHIFRRVEVDARRRLSCPKPSRLDLGRVDPNQRCVDRDIALKVAPRAQLPDHTTIGDRYDRIILVGGRRDGDMAGCNEIETLGRVVEADKAASCSFFDSAIGDAAAAGNAHGSRSALRSGGVGRFRGSDVVAGGLVTALYAR